MKEESEVQKDYIICLRSYLGSGRPKSDSKAFIFNPFGLDQCNNGIHKHKTFGGKMIETAPKLKMS